MTIFSRRTIQRMLDALAGVVNADQLRLLVAKLNRADIRSLHTEWEVLVLFGLKGLGDVAHEQPLGASNPDVFFRLGHGFADEFVADIMCVSDQVLEERNPIDRLMTLVWEKARKAGIAEGRFDYRVRHRDVETHRRREVRLKLPEKARLPEFCRTHIIPFLAKIAAAPSSQHSFFVSDVQHDFQITYRPGPRGYTTASYPAFNLAATIDNNPLYNALREKYDQLTKSGYKGPTGIIACDGGSDLLIRRSVTRDSFSKEQIVQEFFRQHSSISFVLLLGIETPFPSLTGPKPPRSWHQLFLNSKAKHPLPRPLQEALGRLTEAWPPPIENGLTARAQLEGRRGVKSNKHWGISHWGGGQMSRHKFGMSARGLVELLAGRRTAAEFSEAYAFGNATQKLNFFENALRRGLIISDVRLERGTDEDDDWIEFQLSGPDAAIAAFRANAVGTEGKD